MTARFGGWVALAALALGVTTGFAADPPRGAGEKDAGADMGVALVMSGEAARAESVFVSMLSHTRGDARAFNNLGNLRLLRGELGVALAFYDRALRGDSTDAGIQLNRSIALLLMGDDSRAESAAAAGIRLAGGIDQAQTLLGLRAETEPGRAAEKAYINRSEVRALLKSAAAAVPRDTGKVAPPDAGAAGRRKAPTWRPAGPRASDDSEAAVVLYWKR